MNLQDLTFTLATGAYGLNDEYMADIRVEGIPDGIIACQAADKPTAERLRELVLGAIINKARVDELERQVADLKRQCHDHDRRREDSMRLAREMAEMVEPAKPTGYQFGYMRPDGNIEWGATIPCTAIDGANLMLDAGDSEGGTHD